MTSLSLEYDLPLLRTLPDCQTLLRTQLWKGCVGFVRFSLTALPHWLGIHGQDYSPLKWPGSWSTPKGFPALPRLLALALRCYLQRYFPCFGISLPLFSNGRGN